MKHLLLVAFLFLSFTSSFAQRHYREDGRLRIAGGGIRGEFGARNRDEGPIEKKNIIKLNLSSIGFSNFGVQYERALGGKVSFALQGRYMLENTLPGASQLSNYSSDTSNIFASFTMSSWAITPEFRFYVRRALKGFYIAPYARIRSVEFNYPISYIDDNNKAQKVNTNGSFLTFGGGLMFGSNFRIGKYISLDWFILGGHYSTTTLDVKSYSSATLSVNDQQDIRTDLEELRKPLSSFIQNYSYTVSSNQIGIKGTMNSFGLRGAGLNLGFRF